ncbi:NADH-quinone oxidoreductase subunit NuoB [bacterium]|nr:NADH-quinone oxidoreductase subunit NuoB [bacterium]
MGLARGDDGAHRRAIGGEPQPTAIERLIRQAVAHSLWPLMLGLDYTTLELYHAVGPKADIARFGAEVYRPSPRQVDLMIVAGVVNHRMAPVIRRLYEAMAEPRFVIACGASAISGGLFADSYMLDEPLDAIVPVNVYIPGDPPRPEQIIDGINRLTAAIKSGEVDLA